MVFVSMTSDDLLSRTAQDQVYFSGARRRRRNRRGIQPSQEYLNSHRTPLQSLQRSGSDDAYSYHAGSSDPIAGFRITTAYDDDFNNVPEPDVPDEPEENNEEHPTFEEIERLQMGAQMEDDLACSDSDESASDSTSDWDVSTSQFDAFYRHNRTMQSRLRASRRHQQHQRQRQVTSSFVDPPAPLADADTLPQHSGLLRPHAQFYIERAQSMVNIKFDPPPYVHDSFNHLPPLSICAYVHTDPVASSSSNSGARITAATSISKVSSRTVSQVRGSSRQEGSDSFLQLQPDGVSRFSYILLHHLATLTSSSDPICFTFFKFFLFRLIDR